MGAESSQPEGAEGDLPFPESWAVQLTTPIDGAALGVALDGISAMTLKEFLAAEAEVPELEASAWKFDAFLGYAAIAVRRDSRLNKLVPVMVPRRVSEDEFWRLYFCHVHCILRTAVEDGYDGGFGSSELTSSSLLRADDRSISAIVSLLEFEPTFQMLACREFEDILQRDKDESLRAAAGLRMAVARGLIPAQPEVEPVFCADISQSSAEDVAAIFIEKLGDVVNEGCVVIVQGLEGTGKTTLISKLQEKLPRTVCWSDEQIFRAITLLALQYCAEGCLRISVEALTPDVLRELLGSVKFGKFNDKYDIQISRSDQSMLVSEIAESVLRERRVEDNLPMITQLMQGEVIKFSNGVVEVLRASGHNVLVEGRAQKLNYLRTPHRFELTLSDPMILGGRRVAQRLLVRASGKLKAANGLVSQQIMELLQSVLAEMEPAMLSRDLFNEGGEVATSAIVAAFERNSGFLDLASQSEGLEQSAKIKRAAEMLLRRATAKIQKMDAESSPDEIHGALQRELDLMTAL